MDFSPRHVLDLLGRKGAGSLYHANTVTTSCSMLRMGALSSRFRVDGVREPQTTQDSDEIDQQYGIWDCVFVDTSDIHTVVGRHNNYGPVLFQFSPELLLQTQGRAVRITKSNPVNWAGLPDEERWFMTQEELEAGYNPSDIGQMLVIPSPAGSLTFNPALQAVILDNPRSNVSGEDAFNLAAGALRQAAAESGIALPTIQERRCMVGCQCVNNYQANHRFRYKFFLPRMGG